MSIIQDSGPCIPSDPDITGIGVRSAIYAQNLLSFIPAIRILTDGKITYEELSNIEQQSSTILVTAFAILITAIIQACTLGLTNFHATIILNLSWMNNTNLSMYLLLYAYHRRELFRQRRKIISELKLVLANEIKQIATNRVLLIGSAHLTLMAAFGIWLWNHPASFGGSKECTLSAQVLFFGHGVSLASKALRVWSIFIYAILLVPFLNILLPALVFITPFHWFLHLRELIALRDQKSVQKSVQAKSSTWKEYSTKIYNFQKESLIKISTLWKGCLTTPSGLWDRPTSWKILVETFSKGIGPMILGFLILAFVDIVFLVDTELALKKNTLLLQEGDGNWTFGQTLSLLLLLVPAFDFYDILSAQSEKRQQRMRELVEAAEKGKEEDVIQLLDDEPDDHTQDKALMLAAANGNLSIVELLFQPHRKIKAGGRMAFLLASYRKKGEVLNWLSEHVIDREKADEGLPQAIQSAVKQSSWDLVRVLAELGSGIRVDDQEFKDTFLCAAKNGLIDCIDVLIKHMDTRDAGFVEELLASGLHAAAGKGKLETVELLFGKQTDFNTRDEEGNTALLCAAKGKHWEVFMWLCKSGSAVNAKNKYQETALHFAAKDGHDGIVRWLCQEVGADVDLPTSQGKTAFVIAAEHGRLNIVKALMNYKAISKGSESTNALIMASQNGHSKVVQTLLKLKIDVNGKGPNGVTPLMAAAQKDQREVVLTLIDAYEVAQVNSKEQDYKAAFLGAAENGSINSIWILLEHKVEVNGQDPDGVTALMMAVQNGHSFVVHALLASNANANIQGPKNVTALMLAVGNGHLDIVHFLSSPLYGKADLNAQTLDGATALMMAAENGHLGAVQILLYHGANVDVKGHVNALMVAAKNGHLEVVEALLDQGADIEAQRPNGSNALMMAAGEGHFEVVQTLVDHKARVNTQDKDGTTALMLAAAEGHLEVLQLLLANEARVNAQGPNDSDSNVTALMMASKNGHLDVVECLLNHNADVNAKTPDGANSLIMAAQKGHSEVVRALLVHKAEVNSENSKRITALMMAAQDGHFKVVQTLLEHKARADAQGPEGVTALMIAAQNGYLYIVQSLLHYWPKVDPKDLDGEAALQAAIESATANEHVDIVQFLLAHQKGLDDGYSPDPSGKIVTPTCTPDELRVNQEPPSKTPVYPKPESSWYGSGQGYARYNRPSQLRLNSGSSMPATGANDERK